jgi:hypothetical protein
VQNKVTKFSFKKPFSFKEKKKRFSPQKEGDEEARKNKIKFSSDFS